MPKTIFTYNRVLKAYLDCRKHKRSSLSSLEFECHMESNLARLTESLQTKNYIPDRSVYFVVTNPKPREIFATEFTE
jgi:hypothetical protein